VSGELVYVIEDDPNLANIFAGAMQQAGYRPEIILSGDTALERLSVEKPRLILLDLHLPRVSGPEILHHIRKNGDFGNVQVIIATADPLLADIYRDMADFILIKPISFNQLRDLAMRL